MDTLISVALKITSELDGLATGVGMFAVICLGINTWAQIPDRLGHTGRIIWHWTEACIGILIYTACSVWTMVMLWRIISGINFS